MDSFDAYARSMKPNVSDGQILVEVGTDQRTFEEAVEILNLSGITPFRYEVVRKEYPLWVIFFVRSDMMKTAILTLSEAGFTKLSGLNPLAKGLI
jgi:hypothetical protein